MASVSTQSASKPSNLKNTQLTPNDRNAIFHYYMTLNKYFNTNSSENSPGTDRSNSSRAVKARKRLLNLHTYQFFELITDVNDEVERRTSSGQDTEYLLPQDDLHLKRNQARQKLANLSLKRFLDLVDDLSYEIRRRQYDLDPQFDEPVEDKSGFSDVIEQKEFENSPAVNNMGSSTTVTDHETAEKSITHKPSVQQVNVKKANMDWSDEEDEPVQKEVSGSIPKVSNQPLPDFNLPAGFSKQNASISRRASNGNIGLSLNDKAIKKNIEIPFANKGLNENIEVPKINKTVNEGSIANNKDIALQAANKSINYRQDEVGRNLQLKLDDLSNNNSSLVSKNAALNEENVKLKDQLDTEIQNKKRLTDELKNNEEIINHLKSQVETNDKSIDNEQYQAKNYINIVSDNKQLSIENEDLKQKITDLEIANKLLNTSEEIKTDIFDHGNMSNFGEEYFSKGMVPIESVKEFQVKVVDLSKKVQNYNPQQSNKDLFLSAIKLSDIVTSIVKSVEMQDTQQMYTEYCILANTSTTHLITTLKYQSKFSAIFPKIIIQNALLEILGSLYQLIYKAGCNMSNDDKVQSSPNASRQKTRNLTSTSISDVSNDKLNGVDNKAEEKAQNEYTDSPVRPLKITQRMSSLPQIDDPDNFINGSGTSNSINKKHSNTGLFTGMLVTSSKTTSNDNIASTSNKNIKGLSLNLKDSENINPPKLDKKQSQTILNRVKAFEETSFNEGHSTTRDTTIGNDSDVSLESKQQKRSPPKTVKEIDILQKRNSLQSIEDRVSAFGEMKTTKGEQSKKSIGVKQEDLSANVSTSSFEPTAEEKDLNNLLHYLENESIEVISTIQSLLTSIKNPKTTIKELNGESEKIMNVVSKVCRNAMSSVEKNNDLKTIGEYIITSLQDCERRMKSLIETESTGEYPDKSFKQRLAGIAFDIAKNVKKLVKVVEELSLKKEIAHLDQQLL